MAEEKEETRIDVDKASVERQMASIIVESEYRLSQSNQESDAREYEALIDMLEGRRAEKDYDWMSDINMPEMASIILTNASEFANQYFQSRDFVEVRLDGEDNLSLKKSKAAKLCLNNSLNRRELHHYYKYLRARLINALKGQVYAIAWWEQEVVEYTKGYKTVPKIEEVPGLNGEMTPQVVEEQQPIMAERIIKDAFNYDVIDPRNVFTEDKYVYNVQDKDWVIVRSESDYSTIFASKDRNGYINVDKLKEACKTLKKQKTSTEKETYGERQDSNAIPNTPVKRFDVLDRYGKFWAIVKDRWEDGNPKEIDYGLDDQGMPLDDAELVETIISYALVGNEKIIIRFSPTPYIDGKGVPFKPLMRGVCYIHPSKDTGLSDGKNLREIQIAINDMANMAADRAKLATMPTMIGRKGAMDDNRTLYFAPEHVIEVDDPANDLRELMIRDDATGAMNMIQYFTSKAQQVTATFPTTMGELGPASTTATAVAGAESRGNLRANYKSLTFEHTFNADLYQMMLNMTWRFAKDPTLIKLMGDSAKMFDPNEEYSYSPVSSNIETEFSKYKKAQMIDQMMGRLVNVPNPNTAKLLNMLTTFQLELFGKTYPEFKHVLLDETVQPLPDGTMSQPQPDLSGMQSEQVGAMPETPMANASGLPQTGPEQMARMMGGMKGGMA